MIVADKATGDKVIFSRSLNGKSTPLLTEGLWDRAPAGEHISLRISIG
jgi:hypothetical protein